MSWKINILYSSSQPVISYESSFLQKQTEDMKKRHLIQNNAEHLTLNLCLRVSWHRCKAKYLRHLRWEKPEKNYYVHIGKEGVEIAQVAGVKIRCPYYFLQ